MNTALTNTTLKALTLSIITKTTCVSPRTNDDEDKMGKGEQGGGKAIHARYGNRMQAMTEEELRRLMEENSGKYVVYDGKIITPSNAKGGTTTRRSKAVQRRTETNHD